MPTVKPNILIIMSDEHDPFVTGCYGHGLIQTPALDGMAEEGTVFDNAYTNCPICVPARNSFMTGQYCHMIKAWDNGSAIPAEVPTIGTLMEAEGYETVLCGRTHFVGTERLNGWGRRLMDDLEKWKHMRGQVPNRTPEARRGSRSHVEECGTGEHFQTEYDTAAADLAAEFLENRKSSESDKPFLLYTGFMNPHFPLICPEEFLNMYDPEKVDLPESRCQELSSQHPQIQQLRYYNHNDTPIDEKTEHMARACYYGLISFADSLIGKLMETLESGGLKENMVIIYTSDHGEMGGHHGIWQKQCFYENAARVPLIISGPGIPERLRVKQGVSLADILPTLAHLGGQNSIDGLPGESLLHFLEEPERNDRPVFSEYHAQGFLNSGFMLKKGDLKLNWYAGYEPELFDLSKDSEEMNDVAAEPEYADSLEELKKELFAICDPDHVDAEAKGDQQLRRLHNMGSGNCK